jgi:hypothetical protein
MRTLRTTKDLAHLLLVAVSDKQENRDSHRDPPSYSFKVHHLHILAIRQKECVGKSVHLIERTVSTITRVNSVAVRTLRPTLSRFEGKPGRSFGAGDETIVSERPGDALGGTQVVNESATGGLRLCPSAAIDYGSGQPQHARAGTSP